MEARTIKTVLWRIITSAIRSLPAFIYEDVLELPTSALEGVPHAESVTVDHQLGIRSESEEILPRTVDSPHPAFSLNDKTARDLSIWVTTLSNASVISGRFVVTSDNSIVADVIEGARRETVVSNVINRVAPKTIFKTFGVDGPVAMLGARWSTGYFHWITDIIPRIAIVQRKYDVVDDIDYFAFPTGVPSAGLEALQVLGVRKEQLLSLRSTERIKTNRLILPSLPGRTGHPPAWVLSFLRQSFLDTPPATRTHSKNRLYVARQGSRTLKTGKRLCRS